MSSTANFPSPGADNSKIAGSHLTVDISRPKNQQAL